MLHLHIDIFDNLNIPNREYNPYINALFTDGTYDKIILIYNKFKNAATQNVMNENFLPVEAPSENKT